MKGENKSWKSYSSCITLNHCLLIILIVISCVNYSHGFWNWVPFWSAPDCMNNECPGSNCLEEIPHRSCIKLESLNRRRKIGKPLVVFSTLNALYEVELPTDCAKIQVNKTFQYDLSGINAFDYDNRYDFLIWLDKSENKIFWGRFDKQGFSATKNKILDRRVSVNGTHKIRGFAYDWNKEVIIWSDDYGIRSKKMDLFSHEKDIEQQTKILRTLDKSYDRPKVITIDAEKRFIFWTNVGSGPSRPSDFPVYIERIDISGEPRAKKIVEYIWFPIGLAIDTKNTKVYFIESLINMLYSVRYDGTKRTGIHLSQRTQVISMDIFTNYLYLICVAKSKAIQRININNEDGEVETLMSVPNGSSTWVKIINPMFTLVNDEPCMMS